MSLVLGLIVSGPADADPLNVVSDIGPIAALVAAVQGDRGTVTAFVGAGDDPHHFALRPSQARAVSKTDLAVFVGAGLTPWLDGALDGLAPDIGRLVLIDHAPVLLPRRPAAPVEAEDHHLGEEHSDGDAAHAHDEGHDDEHGHGDGDHANELAYDPHVWLSPVNAAAWLPVIADALASEDSDGAEIYRANATKERATIQALAAKLAAKAADRPAFTYVAAHDSWQYAERLAGAEFAGALTDSHDTAPGAAHLAALHAHLADTPPACVMVYDGGESRLATSFAGDLGLPLVPVPQEGPTYTTLLRGWHAAFESCVAGR